jgi:hypothetical protein
LTTLFEENILDDAANALGAAITVDGADGVKYLINPMRPVDWITHGKYLKKLAQPGTQSPLAAISEDLKYLPPEFQAEAIRAAVALKSGSKTQEPNREAIFGLAMDLPAARHQFWLTARANHPGLTLEKCAEIVTEANLDEVLAAALEANGQEKKGDHDPK